MILRALYFSRTLLNCSRYKNGECFKKFCNNNLIVGEFAQSRGFHNLLLLRIKIIYIKVNRERGLIFLVINDYSDVAEQESGCCVDWNTG